MKYFAALLAIVSLTFLTGAQNAPAQSPVIVELFTSEGCSSCPPADEVLTRIDGPGVIALGEHVTYWDRLGWKDRFSQNIFTTRQEAYGQRFHLSSVYTPQVVVNGATEVLGSDEGSVRGAIAKATRQTGATVDLTLQPGGALRYHVTGAPPEAQAFLAVTESRLETSVRAGENGGRTLRHTGVVRSMALLPATSGETQVKLDPAWKRENLKFVVFVQDPATRKIWGAASLPL